MSGERLFKIATGKSRRSERWHNREVSWEWLRDRLEAGIETGETAEEYRRMSRDEQGRIKDVGGFVGGYLKDGRRKASHLVCRSVITFDFDEFDRVHLEELSTALSGIRWAMHSTHKHTEGAWRVRVVIPADRDMEPDEYGAVSRKVAEKIGFAGIDRSTFQPGRLMYWGSHSKGAPYLFEEGEGVNLDVDSVLAEYHDWSDVSTWPLLPEEEAAGLFSYDNSGEGRNNGGMRAAEAFSERGRTGKQEDPTTKKGLIGTFCRTYDIAAAIEKFLPDVYVKAGRNRYTRVGSSTHGGAVVEEDGKFLYSFHSTDPHGLKLMNAWDLVRLHKFSDADIRTSDDARTERLPSFKLMSEFALADELVSLRLMDERRAEAMAEFGDLDFEAFPDTDEREQMPEEERKKWDRWDRIRAKRLKPNKQGEIKTNAANIVTVLEGDPRLAKKLRLDEFTGKINIFGELPWKRSSKTWTDNDSMNLRVFLDREYGLSGKEKINDSLVSVAVNRGYHPVKDYLDSLEWDGEPRLGKLFTDVLGAEQTELNRALAELIFTAAVRRIRKPGEKFDYFIILHGPEGCGKSSLFSLMGGEWFTDSVVTIEGKEGMESIQGKWIVEMGELNGVRKSEIESQKRFISSQIDSYRPAYGRVIEDRPRQCVMVGTTNEDLFLRGMLSSNRRSPVVEIRPELRKIEESVRDYVSTWRDQLWAEANEIEKEGKPLFLGDTYNAEIRKIQDEHNIDKCNPLYPEIDRFLDYYVPENWEDTSYSERMAWYGGQGANDPTEEHLFSGKLREYITVPEILQELLKMSKTDKDYMQKARTVGQYLRTLTGKWEPIGTKRTKIYGVQKTWRRVREEITGSGTELDFL